MAVRSGNVFELESLLLNKLQLKGDISERGLRRTFSSCDIDNSGLINLTALISAIQVYLNGIPYTDIKRLVKCYDLNRDGYVSVGELHSMLATRSATRPKKGRRSKISEYSNENSIFMAEVESERAKNLREHRKNRELDQAIAIISQAKALEEICADMELEINNREKQKKQEERYARACEESLRIRQEAGKPLFPIYSAMGYKEPDFIPARKKCVSRGGKYSQNENMLYETDLGGTGSMNSAPKQTRPKTAGCGIHSHRRSQAQHSNHNRKINCWK